MGIVYRTRDRETDEIVALKVLQPEIARDEDVIARFKSESSLARKITHKNVCRTYDLHRFGATTAIAMEYVEGETLRGLLNRSENLSVRNGLKILRQVIAGLGEAHAQKIIHRDSKLENIFIARDGTVKVMDFGIARSLEARTSKTGTIIGTPAYMSPEQAEGKAPDARSDIYAL
jgi:serine/threonine protein kinase